MSGNSKSVLYIDLLNQTFELKTHKNLNEFLGGSGIGLKLLLDNVEKNPVILSRGPLSGLFPYTSKLSLIYKTDKEEVKELYGGGSFASKMRLSGIDSILLFNRPKIPLTVCVSEGKVDFINITGNVKLSGSIKFSGKTLIDGYFGFGESLNIKNLKTILISGEGEVKIPNAKAYYEIYNNILARKAELSVKYSKDPSCWGCPAGCDFSSKGETVNGAVLPHCLISCQFAEGLYKEIPLAFSCLTVLGFKYNHDDLEKLPALVGDLKKALKVS